MRALVLVAPLLLATTSWAHVPIVHGTLVRTTRQAERIVLANVRTVRSLNNRRDEVLAKPVRTFFGREDADDMRIVAARGLAAGDRCVLFVKRRSDGWESVAPSGSLYPAAAGDDETFARVIRDLAAAVALPFGQQDDAVRAALLPGLTSANTVLRYEAALEISTLADNGHPPSATEKREIQQLADDGKLDPVLRPLVDRILRHP